VKKLKLHARGSLAAVIVFAAALTGALILRPPYWFSYTPIILAAELSALLYYIPAYKNLELARIIVDNTIIRNQLVILRGQTELDREEAEKLRETFEIYVSTFGILLGDKIIHWGGSSGKKLKTVEIGQDYISIDCGTKVNNQNVRLLYSRPDDDTLADIIEKFRYETGVIPVIAGYSN